MEHLFGEVICEATQKLKDVGLYARTVSGSKIRGGSHKRYDGSDIGVVYGYFTLEVLEHGGVVITIAKDSLEEATQFLIDNIKPGVSDEPPIILHRGGPQDY